MFSPINLFLPCSLGLTRSFLISWDGQNVDYRFSSFLAGIIEARNFPQSIALTRPKIFKCPFFFLISSWLLPWLMDFSEIYSKVIKIWELHGYLFIISSFIPPCSDRMSSIIQQLLKHLMAQHVSILVNVPCVLEYVFQFTVTAIRK